MLEIYTNLERKRIEYNTKKGNSIFLMNNVQCTYIITILNVHNYILQIAKTCLTL
jgi:hypothetical protein